MTNVSQDGAYREGLKVVRKQYRATMRNRGGKVYLTLYWENGSLHEYNNACCLVQMEWPNAYVTSAYMKSDATFRLNPSKV